MGPRDRRGGENHDAPPFQEAPLPHARLQAHARVKDGPTTVARQRQGNPENPPLLLPVTFEERFQTEPVQERLKAIGVHFGGLELHQRYLWVGKKEREERGPQLRVQLPVPRKVVPERAFPLLMAAMLPGGSISLSSCWTYRHGVFRGSVGRSTAQLPITKYSYVLLAIWDGMADVFAALAHPTRRMLLDLVGAKECAVGDLVDAVGMSQPAVSKQLGVLRDAGLVKARVHGKQRMYRIDPAPLQDVDAWIARYRPFLEANLDALERHLDRKKRRGA